MANFKMEPMNVDTFIKGVKDKRANEKMGWSVIKDGEYDFDHPLQRRDKQWNSLQRSELIETLILKILPLPAIYAIEEKQDWGRDKLENRKVVLDGKQRLTTIRDFVNDKFALHKSIKPIEIDGEIYEVAGKKFSQLEEVIRDRITDNKMIIYTCNENDITEAEKKEVFRRLNNGKQLTNAQKNSVYLDEDLSRRIFNTLTDSVKYISIEELKKAKKRGRPTKAETEEKVEVIEGEGQAEEGQAEAAPEYTTVENEVSFWGDVAVVGGSAVKNGEDRNLVLQCAMLISGYESGFKDTDIKGYLQSKELDEEDEDSARNQELINEREDVYEKLQNAIKTLAEGILERRGITKKGKKIVPEQNLKKVNIAPIVNGMHLAIENNKADLYINRLIKFFDEYEENGEYTRYVESGTADIKNVVGRRDYFKQMAEQEATAEEWAEVEKVQAERQSKAERIEEIKIQEAERQAEAERLAKEKKKKEKAKTKTKGGNKASKEKKNDESEAENVAEVSDETEAVSEAENKEEKPAKPKRSRSKKKTKKEEVKVAEQVEQEQVPEVQEQEVQEGQEEGVQAEQVSEEQQQNEEWS